MSRESSVTAGLCYSITLARSDAVILCKMADGAVVHVVGLCRPDTPSTWLL